MEELKALNEARVPRFIFTGCNSDLIKIHVFSDSSEEVCCAVLYMRFVSGSNVNLSFIASKTRVAPLKQLSIPRLELMGCLLLSTLVREGLDGWEGRVHVNKVFC